MLRVPTPGGQPSCRRGVPPPADPYGRGSLTLFIGFLGLADAHPHASTGSETRSISGCTGPGPHQSPAPRGRGRKPRPGLCQNRREWTHRRSPAISAVSKGLIPETTPAGAAGTGTAGPPEHSPVRPRRGRRPARQTAVSAVMSLPPPVSPGGRVPGPGGSRDPVPAPTPRR